MSCNFNLILCMPSINNRKSYSHGIFNNKENLGYGMEQQLLKAALDLLSSRYPTSSGGVAALATESGKILTSIAPKVKNDALSVCMEMGACLEAHKINEKITHSLCIYQESRNSPILFLTPCGICQERLAHWGGDVKVAVSTSDNILLFKPLRELMPYHWSIVNGVAL